MKNDEHRIHSRQKTEEKKLLMQPSVLLVKSYVTPTTWCFQRSILNVNTGTCRYILDKCIGRTLLAVSNSNDFVIKWWGRLLVLSVGPIVTLPATENCHFLASTKLYCLATEVCAQHEQPGTS